MPTMQYELYHRCWSGMRHPRYILLVARVSKGSHDREVPRPHIARNTTKGREACVRRAFSDESVRANE